MSTLFLKKYSTSLYPLTTRSLSLNFVPSDENPADLPSRVLLDLDCMLSLASWLAVQRAIGPHTIDLMATPDNVQRDLAGRALPFFSPSPSFQALGVNAFCTLYPRHTTRMCFLRLCLLAPCLDSSTLGVALTPLFCPTFIPGSIGGHFSSPPA